MQERTASALRAAVRLARRPGADLVKIDGAADFPAAVAAVTGRGPRAGPTRRHAADGVRHRVGYEAMLAPGTRVPPGMKDGLVAEAERLEKAALRCSTSPTPGRSRDRGHRAVAVPSSGGRRRVARRAGPDGARRHRLRRAALDDKPDSYAHVARVTLDALTAVAEDVRAHQHGDLAARA